MTTLAELVTPTSAEAMLQRLVNALVDQGLPATAWQAGTVPRTLVTIDAQVLADVTALVANIAKGGFLDTSAGAWLTLLAKEAFNINRNLATPTQRTCRLTAAAGAGPYGIAAGSLWATTSTGKRFTNIAGTTLSAGGTVDLTFQAEQPGSSYNVGTGAINRLVTSLAGVTIVDPASPAVNVAGTDDETDAALRVRCRDRWATLGTGATAAQYRSWVLAASSEITRVAVIGSGVGGIDAANVALYVAGDAGAVSTPAIDAAQSYVAERAPATDAPGVVNADLHAFNVTAQLQGKAAYETPALAAAANVLAEIVKTTPIGGTLYRAKLIEKLMEIDGVDNVVITTPAADIVLGATEVLSTGAYTLSWMSL